MLKSKLRKIKQLQSFEQVKIFRNLYFDLENVS
jgi:hypothetical protein